MSAAVTVRTVDTMSAAYACLGLPRPDASLATAVQRDRHCFALFHMRLD
jgi:hypothetical protein